MGAGQVGGVFLRQRGHLNAMLFVIILAIEIDDDLIVGDTHLALKRAIGRVMAQQMRQCLVIGQVVDRDDLKIIGIPLHERLESLAPDPPEAVDRNACHCILLHQHRSQPGFSRRGSRVCLLCTAIIARRIGKTIACIIAPISLPFYFEKEEAYMAWSSIRDRSTFALGLALGIAAGRIGYPAAVLTRLMITGARQPFWRRPADVGLQAEDVVFPSDDGVTLRGWFIHRTEDDGTPA